MVKVWDETKDARTLTLKPGLNWRGHRAGQHVRVGIPAGGMHYTRTYTISSPPERDDDCFAITVKAIAGGRISQHIVRNIKVGDYLPIGLPQGDFYLPDAQPVLPLFITAGSGITPAISMLRSLIAQNRLPDSVHIHYAPHEFDVIFGQEMQETARQHARYHLNLIHTHEYGELKQTKGYFSAEQLERLCPDWREREIYACGPPAQWDWMKDPEIQSSTWEWDTMSPSDRWMHSHNVVHHTWTNVLGRDLDVGYGIMRVTPMQKWHPFYLLQPLFFITLMLLFEEGVALHEQVIDDHMKGKKTFKEILPMLRRIGRKVWRQVIKDYIAWPGAALIVSIPISFYVPASPWLAFGLVAGANAIANIIRNIWAFMIIFCGHFPAGVHNFTEEQVEGETRARWYLRQLLGSCNIQGGKLFHVLSGNLFASDRTSPVPGHVQQPLSGSRVARAGAGASLRAAL